VLSVTVFGQDPRAISGGTKTEPDPKDKKLIRLIAENDNYRITLGRPDHWRHKTARTIAVYMKLENLSDKPLTIQTSKFSAIDAEGKSYSGLEASEAIKRYFDSHAGAMTVLGGALGAGRSHREAAERKVGEDIRRESLESGDIQPHSFKEGMIFFEAPKEDRFTMKIKLADLWPDFFVFSNNSK
jgi:hypothetical protein